LGVDPSAAVTVAVIVRVRLLAATLKVVVVAIGTTIAVTDDVEGWKSLVPEKVALTS